MDEVVDLLIKRMESNPEEFCEEWDPESDNTLYGGDYRAPKWQRVVYQLRSRVGDDNAARVPPPSSKPLPFLSDEQVERLYDKYVEIQAKEFEKYVLRTLLHKEDTARYEAGMAGVDLNEANLGLVKRALVRSTLDVDMSPIVWSRTMQPGEWVEST